MYVTFQVSRSFTVYEVQISQNQKHTIFYLTLHACVGCGLLLPNPQSNRTATKSLRV